MTIHSGEAIIEPSRIYRQQGLQRDSTSRRQLDKPDGSAIDHFAASFGVDAARVVRHNMHGGTRNVHGRRRRWQPFNIRPGYSATTVTVLPTQCRRATRRYDKSAHCEYEDHYGGSTRPTLTVRWRDRLSSTARNTYTRMARRQSAANAAGKQLHAVPGQVERSAVTVSNSGNGYSAEQADTITRDRDTVTARCHHGVPGATAERLAVVNTGALTQSSRYFQV